MLRVFLVKQNFQQTKSFKAKKSRRKSKEKLQEVINLLKSFSSNSPEEIFDFSWNFYNGLIRPMQIKEEFVELLKIFQELNPKYILEIGTANGGTLILFL
jgi:cephalosporin hydroxylase